MSLITHRKLSGVGSTKVQFKSMNNSCVVGKNWVVFWVANKTKQTIDFIEKITKRITLTRRQQLLFAMG